MKSLVGVLIAFLVGVGVAAGSAIGVVQLSKQDPADTPPVQEKLIDYGER
jgi:hypothetical protein